MPDQLSKQLPLLAATFLTQALSLDEDPAELVEALTELEHDNNSAVFAVRLDSNVGPTAFLIYAYDADRRSSEGVSGRARFEADLQTLEEAQRLDAPGPRPIANGEVKGWIFLLATDPTTFRALTGVPAEPSVEATVADLPPTANTAAQRREAAGELLRLLKDAEAQASTWLAAARAEAPGSAPDKPDLDKLQLDDVETELALFLLSGGGVSRLLQTMNLLIDTAKHRATAGVSGTSANRSETAGDEEP